MKKGFFKFKLDFPNIQEKDFQEILNLDISIKNADKNSDYYYNEALKSKEDYKKAIQNIIIAIKLNGKKVEYHLTLLDILGELKKNLETNMKILEKVINSPLDIISLKKMYKEHFQYSLILMQIKTLINSEIDFFDKNNFNNDDTLSFLIILKEFFGEMIL